MANEQLQQYVATEKARGVTDAALRDELVRTGWAAKDIEEVMGASDAQLTTQALIPSDLGFFSKLAYGRIGRLRYFLGSLFGFVISIVPLIALVALWGVLGYMQSTSSTMSDNTFISVANMLVPILLALSLIIPFFFLNLMLTIRRLHDLNMSGWFLLIGYIPYVGALFSLYILFAPGTAGMNNFGSSPDPKREFIADIFNRNPS